MHSKKESFWSEFMPLLKDRHIWYLFTFLSVFTCFLALSYVNMFGLNPYNNQNFSNPEYKNRYGIKSEKEAQALMLQMSVGYYF
jgi:hypothetical protein